MGDKIQPVTAGKQTGSVAISDEPAVKVVQDSKGRKSFFITQGIVIEGRIQKPSVMYFLNRSPLSWNLEDIKIKLIPKLLGSVKKSPF